VSDRTPVRIRVETVVVTNDNIEAMVTGGFYAWAAVAYEEGPHQGLHYLVPFGDSRDAARDELLVTISLNDFPYMIEETRIVSAQTYTETVVVLGDGDGHVEIEWPGGHRCDGWRNGDKLFVPSDASSPVGTAVHDGKPDEYAGWFDADTGIPAVVLDDEPRVMIG
jgi:hypothetical protein